MGVLLAAFLLIAQNDVSARPKLFCYVLADEETSNCGMPIAPIGSFEILAGFGATAARLTERNFRYADFSGDVFVSVSIDRPNPNSGPFTLSWSLNYLRNDERILGSSASVQKILLAELTGIETSLDTSRYDLATLSLKCQRTAIEIPSECAGDPSEN